jgi:NAD(P)-dependent dehydrogenase (short-subunit alcohol dehydrogenase family)
MKNPQSHSAPTAVNGEIAASLAENAFATERPVRAGFEFEGSIAVVTGAGSGIGRAIAVDLANRGAVIWAIGRNQETLDATRRKLQKADALRAYQADFSIIEDFSELIECVKREYGRLDLLIHSAAVIYLAEMQTAVMSDFDLQYRVNVRAPYLLTQTCLPLLKRTKGQVVFINSSIGLRADRAGLGQYAATKHALRAVADCLREEVNRDGVRVVSVYPGRTATPGQAAVHRAEGKPYRPEFLLQPEDVASAVLNSLMLPRTAEVTDISIRPMTKT